MDPFGGFGMVNTMPILKTVEIQNEPFLLYIDPFTGKFSNYKIVHESTNIGRKKGDNELELNSKYVSRFHARLDLRKDANENDEIWYKVKKKK